ncbi:hypothetical protein Poli38472_006177 [Pythium oligandrum]|uniref:PH domain-containing protein n=1 Tax=Pythium oligandrum TaxID=41045 RepID=A0A8K1CSE9_PYTOL|nr:hypothetical protein Poli38472_006177 [Pythium oligandrum]|eukprot:TMW68709.1 hypothetical protein Poli38472_006177 [Pythium oligandrum]
MTVALRRAMANVTYTPILRAEGFTMRKMLLWRTRSIMLMETSANTVELHIAKATSDGTHVARSYAVFPLTRSLEHPVRLQVKPPKRQLTLTIGRRSAKLRLRAENTDTFEMWCDLLRAAMSGAVNSSSDLPRRPSSSLETVSDSEHDSNRNEDLRSNAISTSASKIAARLSEAASMVSSSSSSSGSSWRFSDWDYDGGSFVGGDYSALTFREEDWFAEYPAEFVARPTRASGTGSDSEGEWV